KDKKKQKKKDTDFTDEMGGGAQESPLTREGFLKTLHKVTRPKSLAPKKSETSE
ncbi:unnamed protein product, partial [marine sediment metagenome]